MSAIYSLLATDRIALGVTLFTLTVIAWIAAEIVFDAWRARKRRR